MQSSQISSVGKTGTSQSLQHFSLLKGNVFSLDNLGSRISVLIYENGQPATISGSVTANFILPDGSTVNVNGVLTTEGDGSKAYVDVPQSCLLIPGIMKIAIKCTSSSVITTLAAIVANVYMTKTDNVITPSQQIITDWNAEISASLANQDAEISDIKNALNCDETDFREQDNYLADVLKAKYAQKTIIPKIRIDSSDDRMIFHALQGEKIYVNVSGSGISASTAKLYFYYVGSESATQIGNITVGQDNDIILPNDIYALGIYTTGVNAGYPVVIKAWVDQENNIEKLYNSVGALRQDIAPVFSNEDTYYYGQFVMRDDQLYMVNTAEHTGAWINNHFLPISVGSSLYQRYLDQLEIMVMTAGEFNDLNSYVAGNYTVRNKKFWRFIVDHTGAWNSAHVVEVTVGEELEKANEELDQIAEEKYDIITPTFTSLTAGYMDKNGETTQSSSYYYCNKITVSEGDIVYREYSGAIRFLTAYTDSTPVPSKGSNNELTSYTVPNGINGIIMTLAANSQDAAELAFSSVRVKHFHNGEYVIKKSQLDMIAEETIEKYDPRKTETYIWKGNLSTNQTVDTGFAIAPKIGFKVGFYGEFSGTFEGITLQIDDISPNQIIVDDTNITLKSRYNTPVIIEHGLTIKNSIFVNAVAEDCSTIKVIVSSDGSQKIAEGTFWVTAYQSFKIINGSTALSNSMLTIGCTTINHRIWLIGDSYISMDSDQRWPYYMDQNGFTKNVMFCGSSGSGRVESERWMNSLIQIGTPKMIVWCMGMNYTPDYESSTTVASDYKDKVEWHMAYCEYHGIELVLSTVPSVPGSGSVSARRHENKNNYVRNSGYRYIDFAKAVGATVDEQRNVTWYEGMLAPDGVHPTAKGAIALFNMAITTVPELTYDYQ
ncbi:MAG: SGNH/GDSL hydrolase family protein [Acinetobacter sp.]|nr:SGNH/GDSL hydrolase family protein [Acinetobacter sp.]